ncbi:MAG: ribosomal L7Ae/L30e/S12e/Gadd45 family protein [Firmicutes bacterium]|nr:ribosomal L7Ae/L30e/S12e/Gadd45 family protein [Bacillota bacterium]
MPLERIRAAKKLTVGTKQTLKAIANGQAKAVCVALDADKHVVQPIIELCNVNGVEAVYVESMAALGKACGIAVRAASAAILEE